MQMRPSRILRKLRAGQHVNSIKLNCSDVRIAQIAGASGYDCLWIDTEHSSMDTRDMENMILAAKVYDMDTLVRVGRGSYSDMIRPLELDATGIMVPHIMSLADAREVARLTRFHPVGRRPVDGGNTDGAFCRIPFTDYIKQANRERFIVIQIEDPEPLAELDQIAAVEGIDILFFGPGDFSHAIGKPGQMQAPEVVAARQAVAAAARTHGKFAATTADPTTFAKLKGEGYQWLNCGADVHALRGYFDAMLKEWSAAMQDHSALPSD